MNTYIISAFPGCGKTYATEMFGSSVSIMDSDSSKFNKDGFPENYVKHILENIGKCDVMFISSHESVRDELDKKKIRYTLFYPSENRRNEFIENYVKRRNTADFIKKIDSNYTKWVGDIDNMESDYCQRIKLSEFGQYIGNEQHFRDLIDKIIEDKKKLQDI